MTHLEALESLKQGKRIDLRAIGFSKWHKAMLFCNFFPVDLVVPKSIDAGHPKSILSGFITLNSKNW